MYLPSCKQLKPRRPPVEEIFEEEEHCKTKKIRNEGGKNETKKTESEKKNMKKIGEIKMKKKIQSIKSQNKVGERKKRSTQHRIYFRDK